MNKNNFLEKILAHKQEEIRRRKAAISESSMLSHLSGAVAPKSLIRAIREHETPAIIAELKKASPSAGLIRDDFNVQKLAQEYQQNGATALSVLTDERFFQGSLDFIPHIRPRIDLPILRKDFIIDAYQIAEARAAGADAILLIVAALAKTQLRDLLAAARDLHLDALVEVHNIREAEIALAAGAELIGINNRDLQTFQVDLSVTERIAKNIPAGVTRVGESGVHSPADAQRLFDAGVHALLIGTHFMKQSSPGAALGELISGIAICRKGAKPAKK